MNRWDSKFIGLCNHISQWSKDRHTKVGAVIVNERNKILSLGYNGFPIGVNDDIESRHERPEKYRWVAHAEQNAIASAAELGVSLFRTTLYCNYHPCPECAKLIVQSGIAKVVYEEIYHGIANASEIFSEGNVTVLNLND